MRVSQRIRTGRYSTVPRSRSLPSFAIIGALIACGCDSPSGTPHVDLGTADLGVFDAGTLDDAATPALEFTCSEATCPLLVIEGETAAGPPSQGVGDPSLVRDAASGRLWLSYSRLAAFGAGDALFGVALRLAARPRSAPTRSSKLISPSRVMDVCC